MSLQSLTRLFASLGYAPGTVRLMLSRSVRDGQFARIRFGKNVYYSPQEHVAHDINEMGVWAFLKENRGPWDGQWYLLTYQIPDDRRELRERLRNRLTKLGFGRLPNSLWISPRDHEPLFSLMIDELSLTEQILVFKGAPSNLTPEDIAARAWRLPGIAERYRRLISVFETIESGLPSVPTGEQSFAAIWEACAHFVLTVHEDPRLPIELLPPDWPGQRAAEFYDRLQQKLYPKACDFFQSIASFY